MAGGVLFASLHTLEGQVSGAVEKMPLVTLVSPTQGPGIQSQLPASQQLRRPSMAMLLEAEFLPHSRRFLAPALGLTCPGCRRHREELTLSPFLSFKHNEKQFMYSMKGRLYWKPQDDERETNSHMLGDLAGFRQHAGVGSRVRSLLTHSSPALGLGGAQPGGKEHAEEKPASVCSSTKKRHDGE